MLSFNDANVALVALSSCESPQQWLNATYVSVRLPGSSSRSRLFRKLITRLGDAFEGLAILHRS
jgi:hypothetical protein